MIEKYLSIDTETTSVNPHTARMLSIGVVEFWRCGDKLSPAKCIDEKFFATPYEVPADASRVNGLTRSKLNELSGGLSLEQSKSLIESYLYSGYNIIGYNINKYDLPVINSNVMNIGWERPNFGRIIDVFELAKRYWGRELPNKKLGTVFKQVLAETGITEKQVKNAFRLYSKNANVQAHNAAWDAYMAYFIYRYLVS